MASMRSISRAEVRRLIRRNQYPAALELAYVMLSERFEALPDGGDQVFGQLFSTDECEAMADVLEVAKNGSLRD